MAVIEGLYDLLLLANLNYAAACTNSILWLLEMPEQLLYGYLCAKD